MKAFRDNDRREWVLSVNVDSIKRCRAMLGVDLLSVLDGADSLITKLSMDPVLLVDILFVLVKPEADKRGVSDEAFGRSMGGDSLDTGLELLLEDLADFFPSGRRQILKAATAKMKEGTDLITVRSLDQIAKTNVSVLLNAGESSGKPPAQSE